MASFLISKAQTLVVNSISNAANDGSPTVQKGLVVTGVTTSTTFSGSGASLTNLPSAQLTGALPALDGSNLTGITQTTINNNANNRLITGSGTANTLEGEANLTFDGDSLLLLSSTNGRRVSFAGGGTSHYMKFDNTLNGIILNGYGGIAFETNGTNERLRIGSNGTLSINYAGNGDNNLHIGCTSSGSGIILKAPGNHYANIVTDCNRSGANNGILNLAGRWNGNDVAYISFTTGTDTTNKDDGYIRMYTRESGQSLTERVQIKEAGGFVSNKGGGSIAFSDGYSAIEARAPEGTTQLTVTNTTYESGTFDNEAGIWFKGNYSGNNERAKSAIIHKNIGDYGVGGLHFCVDNGYDNQNASYADRKMSITKDGYVTKPSNPAFRAQGNTHYPNQTSAVDLVYNNEIFDRGSNYDPSNGRFTAPVSGTYFFYYCYLVYPDNDNYWKTMGFKINGSHSYNNGFGRGDRNSQNSMQVSTYLYLTENDYVQPHVDISSGTLDFYMTGGHAHFFGYLVS